MALPKRDRLRVLIANERPDRLAAASAIVVGLGHQVIASEVNVEWVGPATAVEQPDVALVGLGESSEHALDLISRIVAEAECPVIALLPASDPAFVSEAAKRGIFAYIVDADPESLESSLEIVLLRFAEYHGLEGAFGRRAVTERAKGILMERHGIDEREAFELLRRHARANNEKLVAVAQALTSGTLLLG